MKRLIIYMICLVALVSAEGSLYAQTKTVTYKKTDLYYYGKAIILNSSFYLNNISNRGNDLYFLALSRLEKNDTILVDVRNKDIYNLGMGISKCDTSYLEKIIDKDWYYYGKAQIKKNEKFLKYIQRIDIYNLGVAIMREDLNFLEELN
jgi:hypothetical protein